MEFPLTILAAGDSTGIHTCKCTLAFKQSSLDPAIYIGVVVGL
jgi:hypothetical protein